MKAYRGSGAVALFILNLALEEFSSVLYAPATLPLGKTPRYPKEAAWTSSPVGNFGEEENRLQEFEPRTVQSVA